MKINTSVEVDGTLGISKIENATIDTDKFLVSDGSILKYRTGAQLLSDIGGSVSGITSLNNQTQSVQTLVSGNEGLDFDIVSNAGQHTFNLPDASSTARGVVTIGAQIFAGEKAFVEDLIVNSLTIGEGGAPGSFGINNTAIGISALTANTGNNNTAIGYVALANNVGGFQNTAIGANALQVNIGTLNPAYPGDPVQYFGVYNTAVGYEALKLNTSNNNTAVGIRTLANNTTGFQNTAIGSEALLFNTTGEENTAIGKDALKSNVDANWNTAIGSSALQDNTLGFQNTAIGRFTAKLNISGCYNTAIGVDALTANLSSNYNTALGYKAGYTVTGLQNTFIGAQDDVVATLQLANVQNSIAIGYNAYTTKNNQVVIGNSIVNETLLRGDIKLTTPPTTSPASYDLLTINTFAGLNTGRIESVPSSSLNFLPLAGGNMSGNINWVGQNGSGPYWSTDSDFASIKFYSTGDADINTRLEFNVSDNNNEYFRWTTTPSPTNVLYELMRLVPTTLGSGNAVLTVSGKVIANSFEKSGGNNNQILAAGGGIITAGTNITITGGIISSTGGSTLSMGSISATANANGATISGSILSLTPANVTNGGIVTSGDQTFSANKRFTDNLYITTTTSTASIILESLGVDRGTMRCNSSYYQFNAINSSGYLFKNSSAVTTLELDQSGNATFTGTVTAPSFSTPTGLSTEYLMANGTTTTVVSPALSAYKLAANNTASSAVPTEFTFRKWDSTTYSGTIVWTPSGTPPNTILAQSYSGQQVGNMVSLNLSISYANAGTSNTQVVFALPSNFPTPLSPTGFTTGFDIIANGTGWIASTTSNAVTTGAKNCFLRRNNANGYELVIIVSVAVNARVAMLNITYQTS